MRLGMGSVAAMLAVAALGEMPRGESIVTGIARNRKPTPPKRVEAATTVVPYDGSTRQQRRAMERIAAKAAKCEARQAKVGDER